MSADHAQRQRAQLRALPAVDRLAAQIASASSDGEQAASAAEATSIARAVLVQRRAEIIAQAEAEADGGPDPGAADGAPDLRVAGGAPDLRAADEDPDLTATDEDPDLTPDSDLLARARHRLRPSLRRVLNGTGVVIHTNLGRAPLARAAVAAVTQAAAGYLNLEIDPLSGKRGTRNRHVNDLLVELTGAQDAFVVNNGAGAALLSIAALGTEAGIAVSRGQLVEIGGGFRVPEVLQQARVPLVEVGTTNRTRLADYERALERGAAAILRVHQSNFRTVGFVEEVAIEALCSLRVPVIDDLGSGALAEGIDALAQEPSVRRSVAAGATLICFSADKLLGGPQAGIILGSAEAVQACRSHPLARALRIGRLPLAGLEATLCLYRDPARAIAAIPVLAMLCADDATLSARARRLAAGCGSEECEIVEAIARVGGGALPLLELRGPAVAIGGAHIDPGALAATLRRGDPALIARISEGRVLVDPRTLSDEEVEQAADAIRAALSARFAVKRR